MEDLDKMKVVDLRAKLKEKGLDTNGKKAELIARLKEHEENELMGLAGDDSIGDTAEGEGDVDLTGDLDDVMMEEQEKEAAAAKEGKAQETKAASKPAAPPASTKTAQNAEKTAAGEAKEEEKKDEASNGADSDAKSAAERRAERAARFGIATKELKQQKRIERAKRFGIETKELKEDKRKQRAERFGLPAKGGKKAPVSAETVQKRQERAKRFGLDAKATPASNKKAKKNYSGMSVEELQRLKKRTLRFNPQDADTIEKINSALAAKTSS